MNNVKTVERDEWGVRGIKGKVMVSSRMLAERFDKEHKFVLRVIRDKAKEAQEEFDTTGSRALLDFTECNFTPSEYKDTTGKKNIEYQITKDGFAFIAMGFTGAKASMAKVEYIQRYNAMEEALENRDEAKIGHRKLVGILDESGASYYDYPNEFDMINIIVLGQRAKAFRKTNGIDDKETRAYLTAEQLYCINRLQDMDSTLVDIGYTFAERKAALTKHYNTKLLPKITKAIQ